MKTITLLGANKNQNITIIFNRTFTWEQIINVQQLPSTLLLKFNTYEKFKYIVIHESDNDKCGRRKMNMKW